MILKTPIIISSVPSLAIKWMVSRKARQVCGDAELQTVDERLLVVQFSVAIHPLNDVGMRDDLWTRSTALRCFIQDRKRVGSMICMTVRINDEANGLLSSGYHLWPG